MIHTSFRLNRLFSRQRPGPATRTTRDTTPHQKLNSPDRVSVGMNAHLSVNNDTESEGSAGYRSPTNPLLKPGARRAAPWLAETMRFIERPITLNIYISWLDFRHYLRETTRNKRS